MLGKLNLLSFRNVGFIFIYWCFILILSQIFFYTLSYAGIKSENYVLIKQKELQKTVLEAAQKTLSSWVKPENPEALVSYISSIPNKIIYKDNIALNIGNATEVVFINSLEDMQKFISDFKQLPEGKVWKLGVMSDEIAKSNKKMLSDMIIPDNGMIYEKNGNIFMIVSEHWLISSPVPLEDESFLKSCYNIGSKICSAVNPLSVLTNIQKSSVQASTLVFISFSPVQTLSQAVTEAAEVNEAKRETGDVIFFGVLVSFVPALILIPLCLCCLYVGCAYCIAGIANFIHTSWQKGKTCSNSINNCIRRKHVKLKSQVKRISEKVSENQGMSSNSEEITLSQIVP